MYLLTGSSRALLDQHHDRHRRDGLGHRVDTEDRILSHRHLPLAVSEAKHRVQRKSATPPHLDKGTCQLAGGNIVVVDETLDPFQPFTRHPLLFLVAHTHAASFAECVLQVDARQKASYSP
jgi:hypothetical protein